MLFRRAESFEAMGKEDPELGVIFEKLMLRNLARQVSIYS